MAKKKNEEQKTTPADNNSALLMKMSEMLMQQGSMLQLMQERLTTLENKKETVEVKDEPVPVLNEDNVASYQRDEMYEPEIINKVWKIMYIIDQPKVTRWMTDYWVMMTTVEETRRVGNQMVSDTKYFDSEEDAKRYLENLKQKGTILPGARIVSCFI